MTIQQMREKLKEWHPSWNVDKFTDQQVAAVYAKERSAIVQSIIEKYERPMIVWNEGNSQQKHTLL